MVKKIVLLGCAIVTLTFGVNAGESVDSIAGQTLNEVTVTGNGARQRVGSPLIGVEKLELSKLLLTPSFGGENDIIRSITLLPGVRSEGDGGCGFEVRGGNASQNRVLLNGITLYNPAHVMGIFSTFNDDALGGATLYKGPVPAAYGGASSSVLDTSLGVGDMYGYHASATIGLLSAKIKAEGPIIKDKLSFAVAARRSYVDLFLKMVPKYRSTVMNFYDVTATARYTPSRLHILDATFFISRDNMAVGDIMGMYWGNLGASLNWLARTDGEVTFTTTAAMTRFTPKMEMDIMDDNQMMRTYIHNYSINEKVHWQLSDAHSLEGGFRSELLRVKSAEWQVNRHAETEERSLWENSVWIDYKGNFADRFDLGLGARLNVSSALAGDSFHRFESLTGETADFNAKTYVRIEPRATVRYSIDTENSVKAGVGLTSQNLHEIRSSSTSFPFDRYALTSAYVKPEEAVIYSIGYNGMTPRGDYDWSVEAYYRDIANVYDYKDGRSTFSDILLENIILGGKGRSYGAEFMLRKNSGRLTGWVSYTISQTRTKIPGINDGRWYDATNDRRHDFSVTAIWQLTDRWNLSASWIYLSGRPLTAPDVKYELSGVSCYYYSKRNSYKTPSVHRLDLAATYTHTGVRFTYQWALGIYNAYCRYNPYVIYFEDDDTKPSGTRAVQMALYGLIPSVSYTLKF